MVHINFQKTNSINHNERVEGEKIRVYGDGKQLEIGHMF